MTLMAAKAFSARLNRTVFRIRDCIRVDRRTFADMMGMKTSRYAQIAMQGGEFSIQELQSLAEAVDLDLDLMFHDKVDYVALERQFQGDREALPERYAEKSQLFGRAKATQVIYSYLATYHGEDTARRHFRRRQLHPAAFADATAYVHPLIASDLVSDLAREGYSDDQIRSIGTMTLATSSPAMVRTLGAMKDPKSLYSYVYEELVRLQYDRMSDYKIVKLTDSSCVTVCRTREEAKDIFKRKVIDNRQSCLYRQGVNMSFLANITSRFAKVREKTCMHLGDSNCTFEILWN